jgi:hypothetical protein
MRKLTYILIVSISLLSCTKQTPIEPTPTEPTPIVYRNVTVTKSGSGAMKVNYNNVFSSVNLTVQKNDTVRVSLYGIGFGGSSIGFQYFIDGVQVDGISPTFVSDSLVKTIIVQ